MAMLNNQRVTSFNGNIIYKRICDRYFPWVRSDSWRVTHESNAYNCQKQKGKSYELEAKDISSHFKQTWTTFKARIQTKHRDTSICSPACWKLMKTVPWSGTAWHGVVQVESEALKLRNSQQEPFLIAWNSFFGKVPIINGYFRNRFIGGTYHI